MVLAIVHPAGNGGKVVALEGFAVVATHEILRCATAEGTARVDVEDEHVLVLALEGQANQVRALPNAVVVAIGKAKTAVVGPVLEVVGAVELHFLAGGQNHLPLLALGVPEQLGIAEIPGVFRHNYRVAGIFGEAAAIVVTVSNTLGLAVAVGGVHGNDGIAAETCHILFVHNGAAAENGAQIVRSQGNAQVLPVHQILGNGVSPVHVAPEAAVRVVLEEKMPFSVLVHHAVGVVHPAPVGREVVSRTVFFLLVGVGQGRGGGHLAPAHIVRRIPAHAAALTHGDVQQDAAAVPLAQVQRNQVVGFVNSQGNIGLEDHCSIGQNFYNSLLGRLLHREQDVAVVTAHLHHTVGFTQMGNGKALCPGNHREQQSQKR